MLWEDDNILHLHRFLITNQMRKHLNLETEISYVEQLNNENFLYMGMLTRFAALCMILYVVAIIYNGIIEVLSFSYLKMVNDFLYKIWGLKLTSLKISGRNTSGSSFWKLFFCPIFWILVSKLLWFLPLFLVCQFQH